MSSRTHWKPVRSSVKFGDVISGCRDNDTHSYRLFCNNGWRDVKVGNGVAHQFDSCECCDLSIEDLRALAATINEAIATHVEWPEFTE